MWSCPRCGEQNEDTFKECWKCISDAMERPVAAVAPEAFAPPPVEVEPPPRKLRSLSSVLVRIVFAFVIATLIGLVVFHRNTTAFEEAAVSASIFGAVIAGLVGIVFWALFPYVAEPARESAADERDEE